MAHGHGGDGDPAAGACTRRSLILFAGLPAALALLVFWPSVGHGFLTIDDPLYVTDNRAVAAGLSPASVAWAFNIGHAGNWHPLTWLSHMLDVELFGLDPAFHHLVNVLIHAVNAALVFALLHALLARGGGLATRGQVRWASCLAAALFAVHPLRIESVAWISERKDVLSASFFLITVLSYLFYTERPGARRLAVVFFTLALSLASKPMAVSLPLVLLLLDLWPLGRRGIWRLVAEKVPLIALAAGAAWLAVLAQQSSGALSRLDMLPLGQRLANAVVAYLAYVVDLVWPFRLAVFYPIPMEGWPVWRVATSSALLLVVSALALKQLARRRWIAAGWLWYLVTLIPVIGLVHVGMQARADRYTYLPHVGLLVVATCGALELLRRRPGLARPLIAIGGAVVAVAAMGTLGQLSHWRDTVSLLTRATEVTRNNFFAHYGLGLEYALDGRMEPAIYHAGAAVVYRPLWAEAHAHLGYCWAADGDLQEALRELHQAIDLEPDNAWIRFQLGTVYYNAGRYGPAAEALAEAVRLDPRLAVAHTNLALAYKDLGREDEALESYRLAVGLDRKLFEAQLGLGALEAARGAYESAIEALEQAARLRPRDPKPHLILGLMHVKRGDPNAARLRLGILEGLDPPSARKLADKLGPTGGLSTPGATGDE